MITLVDITEENLGECEQLERKSQQYVGGPLWVIAEAYVHRDNTTAHAICVHNIVVGLVCLIWDLKGSYSFTDLFIADNYQGRGYAKQAVKTIIDTFQRQRKHDTISIFVHDTNEKAIHIYKTCGFIFDGYASWDHHFIIMKYSLA